MTSLNVRKPMFENIVIDIDGEKGNAYYLLGFIKNLLKKLEYDKEEINQILDDMMSKNYEHLINIVANYVVIESEYFDFEEIM